MQRGCGIGLVVHSFQDVILAPPRPSLGEIDCGDMWRPLGGLEVWIGSFSEQNMLRVLTKGESRRATKGGRCFKT